MYNKLDLYSNKVSLITIYSQYNECSHAHRNYVNGMLKACRLNINNSVHTKNVAI